MTPRIVALLALLPLGCSLLVHPDTRPSTRDGSVRSAAADEEAYRDAVRDYTYAYVDADGEAPDFAGGLVTIAARHGVADWDAAAGTWIAIGAGLARAQVSSATLADFKRTVGRADPLRTADMQRGFDHGR
ncbi:MAG TPA: hypothetical protein VGK30_16520 [Candidatus Binatia bacterium]|jgi:hypothetical protein